MLRRLGKVSRWRMTVAFAVAYLVCVLAPHAALALTAGSATFHCLSGHHHHKPAQAEAEPHHHHHGDAHAHGGGTHHHGTATHSDPGDVDSGGMNATCCGLFCVSAMPVNAIPDMPPALGVGIVTAALDNGFAGRGPVRIDRPPNLLLPH
jgi:hypothetical protein